jgi:hypothetical protein
LSKTFLNVFLNNLLEKISKSFGSTTEKVLKIIFQKHLRKMFSQNVTDKFLKKLINKQFQKNFVNFFGTL